VKFSVHFNAAAILRLRAICFGAFSQIALGMTLYTAALTGSISTLTKHILQRGCERTTFYYTKIYIKIIFHRWNTEHECSTLPYSIVRHIKTMVDSVIKAMSLHTIMSTCMHDYGTVESMLHASLCDILCTFFSCF